MSFVPGMLVLGCALVLWTGSGHAAEPAVPPQEVAQPSESQQRARELLLGMARFVGGARKFQLNLRVGYDVVQESGQKIEFGERREISVERPGKFLSIQRESHGREDVLLFDGENITVSDAGAGVYARAPQPGDLDASVMYFVRDLKMRLPIAPLFMSRFAEELEGRVVAVDYVEQTDILGTAAHHLAGRTELVDFQVWIRDGEQPLPLRLILSYRTEEGHPDFWADFSDWNLNPRFARNTFRFEPPKGSQQIVFAVQLAPVTTPAAQPAPTGSVEETP